MDDDGGIKRDGGNEDADEEVDNGGGRSNVSDGRSVALSRLDAVTESSAMGCLFSSLVVASLLPLPSGLVDDDDVVVTISTLNSVGDSSAVSLTGARSG